MTENGKWMVLDTVRTNFGPFGMPPGIINAVTALCQGSNGFAIFDGQSHFLCPIGAGAAQGCPLANTVWAVAMDVIIRAVADVVPDAACGRAGGCADDLAVLPLRNSLLPELAKVFRDAERLGKFVLNAKKDANRKAGEAPTRGSATRAPSQVGRLGRG